MPRKADKVRELILAIGCRRVQEMEVMDVAE
jgi:hypothetical protein